MKKNKNNGFTLIELTAVLVVLSLIALIVTPLVMNIVKKAKHSANERSVDAYGKATELAVATYLLDTKEYPDTLEGLKVEYTGSEVMCEIQKLNEDGSIYLSKCSVGGVEVKDSSTDDGYYHYGKTTNIDEKYQSYKIGDLVTYNGMNFYVIEASDEKDDKVTLLKETPLLVDEVNKYGIDENGVNHVNRYTTSYVGSSYNYRQNGYGGMAYYTSEACGYVNDSWNDTGCTTDYSKSDIKYVVDNWSKNKLNQKDLKEDSLGYKTRLLTYEELMNNLGYSNSTWNGTYLKADPEYTPFWVYFNGCWYWTMSTVEDSNFYVWYIYDDGLVNQYRTIQTGEGMVRPVITLSKSAI